MWLFISLIALIIILLYKTNENFDSTGTTFLPLGRERYGLRGEPLTNRPLADCYWDQYDCYKNHWAPYTPLGANWHYNSD